MRDQMVFSIDKRNQCTFAPFETTQKFGVVVAANTPTTFTMPQINGQYVVVAFSYDYGVNVWVDDTGAPAAFPASPSFVQITSVKNPGIRSYQVTKTNSSGVWIPTEISFISDASCHIGIEVWTSGMNV